MIFYLISGLLMMFMDSLFFLLGWEGVERSCLDCSGGLEVRLMNWMSSVKRLSTSTFSECIFLLFIYEV